MKTNAYLDNTFLHNQKKSFEQKKIHIQQVDFVFLNLFAIAFNAEKKNALNNLQQNQIATYATNCAILAN